MLTLAFALKERRCVFSLERSTYGDVSAKPSVERALPDFGPVGLSGSQLRTRLKAVYFVERSTCVL